MAGGGSKVSHQDPDCYKYSLYFLHFYRPPPAPIDWELPQTDYYAPAPVVSAVPDAQPPVKRFKEKTISGLDEETASSAPATFKKRKFANKGNARKPLDE